MTSASYLPAIAIHTFPRYVGSLVLGDHVFFFALFWEHISFGGFENQKMSVLYPPTCLVVWIYNSRFRNISLRIVKWVLHCLLVSIVDVKKSNVISSPPPFLNVFNIFSFFQWPEKVRLDIDLFAFFGLALDGSIHSGNLCPSMLGCVRVLLIFWITCFPLHFIIRSFWEPRLLLMLHPYTDTNYLTFFSYFPWLFHFFPYSLGI